MDLQTRKLNVIEYLIGLNDEKVFSKIESTIFENMIVSQSAEDLKPFTRAQIIDRANRTNADYKKGSFKSQEELEADSHNW